MLAAYVASVSPPHASYLSPKGGKRGALSHVASHSGVSSGMIPPTLLIACKPYPLVAMRSSMVASRGAPEHEYFPLPFDL